MLIRIVTYLVLVALWIGFTGFKSNYISLFVMFSMPLAVILLSSFLNLLPKKNCFKLSAFCYFSWMLKEILMSSIAVAKISWRRNLKIQPILESIKTIQNIENGGIGAVVYANSITLTPGTVTISTKDKNLLVHALDISFIDDLKEGVMDSKIKKIIK